jgi:teichuronic acid exporter
MQLLAVVATFRSVQPLIPQVLMALRESRRTMNNTLLTVLVLPLGFYAASRWGINGVAVAWLIMYPILAAPLFIRTFHMLELPVRKYVDSLWPATSSCLVMAGAVGLAEIAFPHGHVSLITKILVGGAAYTGSLLVLHRQRVLVLRDFIRQLRTGAPAQATSQRTTAPVETELQPLGAA